MSTPFLFAAYVLPVLAVNLYTTVALIVLFNTSVLLHGVFQRLNCKFVN